MNTVFERPKNLEKVKILRFLRNGLETELESWEGPGMALGCLPEAKSTPKWPEKSGKFPFNIPAISPYSAAGLPLRASYTS